MPAAKPVQGYKYAVRSVHTFAFVSPWLCIALQFKNCEYFNNIDEIKNYNVKVKRALVCGILESLLLLICAIGVTIGVIG